MAETVKGASPSKTEDLPSRSIEVKEALPRGLLLFVLVAGIVFIIFGPTLSRFIGWLFQETPAPSSSKTVITSSSVPQSCTWYKGSADRVTFDRNHTCYRVLITGKEYSPMFRKSWSTQRMEFTVEEAGVKGTVRYASVRKEGETQEIPFEIGKYAALDQPLEFQLRVENVDHPVWARFWVDRAD